MSQQAETNGGLLLSPAIIEAIAQRVAELLRADLPAAQTLLTPARWQSGSPSLATGFTSMQKILEPSDSEVGREQGFGSTPSASGRHSGAHRGPQLPGTVPTAQPVGGRVCSP
jgi:hypothetical protein